MPVTGRCQVAGTSLICSGAIYRNSDGKIVHLQIDKPVPMWEFTFHQNQKDAVVIPAQLLDSTAQKKAFYRIVQFKDKFLWVERNSTITKVGVPFQNNIFLIVKDNED